MTTTGADQTVIERLAALPKADRDKLIANLPPSAAVAMKYEWRLRARQKQLPPEDDDWLVWMILAGRGFGKTRTGVEWFRSLVEGPTPLQAAKGAPEFLTIVGDNPTDIRRYIIDSYGGFERNTPPNQRPHYSPTKQELAWPNGCKALLFSAEDPEAIRGASSEVAWCDEMAKWRQINDVWDNLQFAMREGLWPRILVTTTPKPKKLIKQLVKRASTRVVVGTSYENRANLAAKYYSEVIVPYEGRRLGRQEIRGEILEDVPGALWDRENLDLHRKTRPELPDLQRVVIGIDPAAGNIETRDRESDESAADTGIVAAALGVDGRGYVLADTSCDKSPDGWAKRAVSTYDLNDGDAIVAEVNNGGDMVASTIRTVRPTINVISVRASRGKVTRAEPIAALYEQGRISHVGEFPLLEDQMMSFTTHGITGGETGDRVDALVWAFTQLFPSIIQVQAAESSLPPPPPPGAGWMAG